MINITTLENGNVKASFDIEDIDRECWCWGNFYEKIGFVDLFKQHPDKADVNNVKANYKTNRILIDKIKDNFKLVNLTYYPEVKVKKYRQRRKKLNENEELSISMDALNYSPSINNDGLEDMCIVFEFN